MSSASRGGGAARLLRKQKSWSPDTGREAAWARRREAGAGARRGRSWSVTEDDLDELRGCVDLGFGFDAGCGAWRSRLAETFPALDLYYAVHGAGEEAVQLEQEACACGAAASDSPSEESSIGSHMSILSPGDPPETVKMRLKQWAQLVALSVHNSNCLTELQGSVARNGKEEK
ncbi:uncharacterized protein LOC133926436 [Phragmites australis]|uniref:uncharacterized protein LOC133926436 n=1 Tax=Phragmites australis TaxID=29695 RepID=UPI002D789857|nr:uncharacterized protein LOC133926436 [Phragmites australis]